MMSSGLWSSIGKCYLSNNHYLKKIKPKAESVLGFVIFSL